MTRLLPALFVLFLLVVAVTQSVAQPGGLDLSVGACPDNLGAMPGLMLDCASAGTLVVLGTWASPVALPDVASLLGRMSIAVNGDLRFAQDTVSMKHTVHRMRRPRCRERICLPAS